MTTDPGPDALAAYLDDARKRWDVFGEADSMPRLLAAVEAGLSVAGRWQSFGDGHDAQSECARELREAISRELLGEGKPDA